jgi:catechol 2,3-dioxygenase-like lactoylglutathione lyase family enzyme
MDPRISFITLAVADPEAAYSFYVDGLESEGGAR